jgi:sulfate permease, SulP family
VSTTSTIATPTATTLVTAGVAAGSADALRDLTTLTFLVGVILILAWLLKLGALVENINQATLIGIKVGVGSTVAVAQLPKLLGVDNNFTGHGFIRSLGATAEAVPNANLATVLLSVGSIALLLLLGRFAPRVPGQLVVVIVGILLAAYGGIVHAGVQLIAPVPSGIPLPTFPTFQDLGALVPGALAIAIMAFLESASVARGVRRTGESQIDSNRELFATGAVSLVGAFFNSMPAAGGFSQTAVNLRAGARSQIATLVTVVLAVLVALFLGPVLSNLPQATLASMVMVAVIGLIDVPGMVRLARVSPIEFWLSVATAVVGLTVGLLAAVAVGVFVTLILLLRELNRPWVEHVGDFTGGTIIKLDAPLYTGNVLGTQLTVERLIEEAGNPRFAVLDFSVQMEASVTVLDALSDLDHELAGSGVELHIAGTQPKSLATAERLQWWRDLAAQGRVHDTVAGAVDVLSARA